MFGLFTNNFGFYVIAKDEVFSALAFVIYHHLLIFFSIFWRPWIL
jgi:hypothetical protein